MRITHPRTEAARRRPPRPAAREIDEQTPLGAVYMSSLIRSQRRLAVTVFVAVFALLGGLALLGALAPGFAAARVFGLPLPWLLLGVLVYPLMIALAAYTVRHAERNERAFTELLHRR